VSNPEIKFEQKRNLAATSDGLRCLDLDLGKLESGQDGWELVYGLKNDNKQ
jgi:hypothetical protein